MCRHRPRTMAKTVPRRGTLLRVYPKLAEIRNAVSHFLSVNDVPETNIATLWETIKAVVRSQFIAIAARQNALRHARHQQLEGDIRALEETHRQSGSLAVRRQLTTQRKQLRALDEDKPAYALLRTKQKFYTGGNKAGRLRAHRLRTQATERRVAEQRLPYETLSCQDELIRLQFERFYSDLYSAEEVDPTEIEEYLDTAPVARLPPPRDSATLENDITTTEVLAAIHHLKPNKALGADGFGAEFYKALGTQLAPIQTRLYNALGPTFPLPPTMQLVHASLSLKRRLIASLLLGDALGKLASPPPRRRSRKKRLSPRRCVNVLCCQGDARSCSGTVCAGALSRVPSLRLSFQGNALKRVGVRFPRRRWETLVAPPIIL
ncbi:hypothetical protein NDU88_003999 [Pleurodeles waltl]|uniref:Uncharacterized protein n=1 Tax=Pleurodeles waltl TaxID=8319 RepID=A0AAV7KZ19_PLEWA|nr:hypothetical protein NDU88_003999 [Pleurodeles waltl]